MRIAFVVPRCRADNSHGRYVLGVAGTLGRAHNVHIVSSAFPSDVNTIPATLHQIPLPNWPTVVRLAAWWAAAPMLVRSSQFDILHTIGADAPGADVVTAPCCNAAIRHAMAAAGNPTHGLSTGVPHWFTSLSQSAGELADRTSTVGAQRVLVPSARVADELNAFYGVPRTKTTIVPWGVDLESFSPHSRLTRRNAARKRFGCDEEAFVCLFVGGAYRLKGLLPLFDALRLIADPSVRLICAGVQGNAELERHRIGLDACVIFERPGAHMLDLYAAADVFVLPTLYDGFSLAALEAMACGLPTIVSAAAGISDLLDDRVDALILKRPTDASEIATALSALRNSRRMREEMGARARLTAEQYSWATIGQRILQVYDEIGS